MSEPERGSFIERWSRLKARARAEAPARPPEPASQVEVDQAAPPAQAVGEAATPAAGDAVPVPEIRLPDLDALDADSDYGAFLAPGVDALQRRRALRKLFHSPKFNVLDGLDDYMGDYTSFEPLGSIVTSDMRHQIERAAERLAERLGETPDEAPATPAPEATLHEEPEPDDGTTGTA